MAEPFEPNNFDNLAAGTEQSLAFTARGPRMYIQTLEPLGGALRTVEAQFNPVGFEDGVETKYVGWEVPGLSHEVLQFISTKNYELPFELRFIVDQSLGKSTELIKRFLEYRRILFALAYPKSIARGGASVNGAAPHRVLVVWPELISMTCVLKNVKWRYDNFNLKGQPIDMTAKVTFCEIRDARISADEVYVVGTQRGGDPLNAPTDFSSRF